ncbi:MAG: cbb3-type cytochrome c oxidase subunit I [Pseudomonadota bacterium]|jgi:cytochrome o ubiquinol oxidase subunit 1|nr:cbb3-type cytochrome c oxidase subunit I [Pseudomonadota bacterium]
MAVQTDLIKDPHILTGKLHWGVIPYTDPVVLPVMIASVLGGLALFALITYKGWWGYLWKEWITSVDHKKIGIMYVIVSLVMLFRGFSDAVLMRTNQALSVADEFGGGYLPPEHYDQIFTAHGVIMIFFVATPLMVGIMNVVMPLQIGARDVAFPVLNSLSFWLFFVGAMLVNISLFVGEFAATGWLAYTPLSGIDYSPGVGVDYWIWALQISGIGTTLTALNFVATILKMRAPGMDLMKMPVFTWTTFIANLIALVIFPILTVAIGMLTLDRYFDFNFFTNDNGGNQMMWVNLIWAWGHPEVYFLILPAFGMITEVVATFSRKRLFGYVSLVWATAVIGILSFLVWLHHFFTMGSGASVNAFFGIMTMIIGIPTGVKLYNWIFTMYKGRVELTASMWWVIAMLITFTIGGMTGVMLAIPANDFMLHNSMFVPAHFHNVIIGGAVYGYFAGMTYWFPKATGFKLNETLGKASCAFWFFGYFFAWIPMYFTGFDGMTRRLQYVDNTEWITNMNISLFGVALIAIGIGLNLLCIAWSIYKRNDPEYRDETGDPWDAPTLEWYTSSPPQFYNFGHIPHVDDLEPLRQMKKDGVAYQRPEKYERIHMPKNSWMGPVIGLLTLPMGFGLVWHIWWMVGVSFLAIIAAWFRFSFERDKDYYVEVEEVEKIEGEFLAANQGRSFTNGFDH